jgi:undecaprenyl-diphosphatase
VTSLDAELFRFLYQGLGGPWLVPMVALSIIGGGWGAFFLVPLYAARGTRHHAIPLGIVLGATGLVVNVLKRIVGRSRPFLSLHDVRALVFEAPRDFSFPSGHAAGSFAFAIFLATVLVRTAPPERKPRHFGIAGFLCLLAIGVALSRVALGVHFPGDVLAGALLGGSIGLLGARVHLGRRATV